MIIRNKNSIAITSTRSSMRQLIVLCMMLLMVLLLMNRAKQAGTWAWLTDLDRTNQLAVGHSGAEPAKPLIVHEELPPGVFLADAQESRGGEIRPHPSSPGQKQPADDLLPQIDRTVFEGIRDKTKVIPPRAYFHLLDVARRLPVDELEQQAQTEAITFVHLSKGPEQFRGKPIFLRGHLRRMTEVKVVSNREGIERLWEGWLFTEESQDNPYVIIVSRLPETFPLGGSILEEVSFAGHFLKLWAYQAGDGDRYAPLLLGHRIVWHPRPAAGSTDAKTHGIMLALVACLVAGLMVVSWWARRSLSAMRRATVAIAEPPTAENVRAMNELTGGSTDEYLAGLVKEAEEPRADEPPRES